MRRSFRDVEVGDSVTRMIAGVIPDVILVTGVDDKYIYCNPFGWEEGWTFDRDTGLEYDPDLSVVASYLADVRKAGASDRLD